MVGTNARVVAQAAQGGDEEMLADVVMPDMADRPIAVQALARLATPRHQPDEGRQLLGKAQAVKLWVSIISHAVTKPTPGMLVMRDAVACQSGSRAMTRPSSASMAPVLAAEQFAEFFLALSGPGRVDGCGR